MKAVSFKYNLLRRYLLFPFQQPDIVKGEELVVAFHKNSLINLINKLRNSKWNADDRRDIGNIGFLKQNLNGSLIKLQKYLWDIAIVGSKNYIDNNNDLVKLVIHICLKEKRSRKFIFYPRHNKKILNDVLSMGLMKSLSLNCLYEPFIKCLKYSKYSSLSPEYYYKLDMNEIKFTGERGLFPDILKFNNDMIISNGFVGGGKDLGLVYIIEYSLPELENIACKVGGIVLDSTRYNYNDIINYYNLRTDGWSESILHFICD